MAWVDIPDSDLDSESEIRDAAPSIFKILRDNQEAIFRNAAGAPEWKNEAFKDEEILASDLSIVTPIPNDKFSADCVTDATIFTAGAGIPGIQSKMDTGTGLVKHKAGATPNPIINPAGIYMLGYQASMDNSNGSADAGRYIEVGFSGIVQSYFNKDLSQPGSGVGPFGLTYMFARANDAFQVTLVSVDIKYMEASPPYNLGAYEVPFFLYATVAPGGEIVGWWGATAPPWAYNGPTDIAPNHTKNGKRYRRRRKIPYPWWQTFKNRDKMEANLAAVDAGEFEEIEITPEFKNADMDLIPQPLIPPKDHKVVLIDPASPLVSDIHQLERDGEPLGPCFDEKYLDIRPTEKLVGFPSPPGVDAVAAQWRIS